MESSAGARVGHPGRSELNLTELETKLPRVLNTESKITDVNLVCFRVEYNSGLGLSNVKHQGCHESSINGPRFQDLVPEHEFGCS